MKDDKRLTIKYLKISKEIEKLRESLNLSKIEFGKVLGFRGGNIVTTYNKIASDSQALSTKSLALLISAYPDLNLNWLLKGGDGVMWCKELSIMSENNPSTETKTNDKIKALEQQIALLQAGFSDMKKAMDKLIPNSKGDG